MLIYFQGSIKIKRINSNNCVRSGTVFECTLNGGYINTINYLEIIKCDFLMIYNTEFISIPVLPLTNNIQKCFKPPDCLLGIVTQPTDSRLNKTTFDTEGWSDKPTHCENNCMTRKVNKQLKI